MNEPAGLGRRFSADVEMCDLDARLRSGPSWPARSVSISTSRLWVRTRRMCYTGARVAVAIHLVDARPVVLVGTIRRCEYDAESMYDVEIELETVPGRDALRPGGAALDRGALA